MFVAGSQRGGQGQKGHERQVLKQQHAEREPSVGAVQLRPLGQLVQDDGRGAHGQSTPNDDGREPLETTQACEQREHDRGRPNLRGAEPEHLRAHGDHARQRELQTQGEEQKHHAELGQQTRGRGIRHHPQSMRSERQTDQQVPHHGRQPQPPCQGDEENGAGQEDEYLGQRLDHLQRNSSANANRS